MTATRFNLGDRVVANETAGDPFPGKIGTVGSKRDGTGVYYVDFDFVGKPGNSFANGGTWLDENLEPADQPEPGLLPEGLPVASDETRTMFAVFYKGDYCVTAGDRGFADRYIAEGVLSCDKFRLADYEVRTYTVRTITSEWSVA